MCRYRSTSVDGVLGLESGIPPGVEEFGGVYGEFWRRPCWKNFIFNNACFRLSRAFIHLSSRILDAISPGLCRPFNTFDRLRRTNLNPNLPRLRNNSILRITSRADLTHFKAVLRLLRKAIWAFASPAKKVIWGLKQLQRVYVSGQNPTLNTS